MKYIKRKEKNLLSKQLNIIKLKVGYVVWFFGFFGVFVFKT